MDTKKLEKIKSYGFYQDYLTTGDFKTFLDNLEAFRKNPDLNFSRREIREIEHYIEHHDRIGIQINEEIQRFSGDFRQGSVEGVYDDVDALLDDFGKIAPFDKVFKPVEFESLLGKMRRMFNALQESEYPKLEELLEKYKRILREIES